MTTDLLPVALVAAPLAALVLAGALGRRRTGAALAVAAGGAATAAVVALAGAAAALAGSSPTASLGATPVLVLDPLAALVAPVLAVVATTVLVYARRNLHGDPQGHRFAMAASLLLAATVVVTAAAGLPVLVAGWVLGSLATVGLVAYRGTPPARAAATRVARALVLGDAALVVAAALVATVGAVGTGGGATWAGLGGQVDALGDRTLLSVGPLTLTATGLVAGLLALGALARAGQLPLPRWLPGTVAAPTPVSALLHAGAVNAGAVLLIRTTPVLDAAPVALGLLAAACLATLAVAVPAVRARPDVKGQLAESTSAQMAFMLLACAVGAPVVALTHLVGHSLYKSARFLGAGGALGREVTRRRWHPTVTTPSSLHRVAAVATGGAVAWAWMVVSAAADQPAAERWVVAAALAAVAGRATLVAARHERPQAAVLLGVTLVGLATAAAVALGAGAAVGSGLAHADVLPVGVVLAALAVLAAAGHAVAHRPALAAAVGGLLAPSGSALAPAVGAGGGPTRRPVAGDPVPDLVPGSAVAWADSGR